jgi:hypothetical protein
MRRIVISGMLAVALAASSVTVVLGHGGGHRGGCEDFGHINRAIGQDPTSFGFGWAENLGDIVSWFASLEDEAPGVGDIVENVDHLACG